MTIPKKLPDAFKGRVKNPDDDPRLATCAMIALDYTSGLLGFLFLTNKGVWVMWQGIWGKSATEAYTSMRQIYDRKDNEDFESMEVSNAGSGCGNIGRMVAAEWQLCYKPLSDSQGLV